MEVVAEKPFFAATHYLCNMWKEEYADCLVYSPKGVAIDDDDNAG